MKDKFPPIYIDKWWTAHTTGKKDAPLVAFHFISGDMESAIILPANKIKEVTQALENSANLAIEKSKAGGEN